MNVLIFAGCNDRKLLSHINPVLESDLVDKVYLVRQGYLDYIHPKLYQYPSFKIFRKVMPLREVNRVITGLYILLFKKIDLLIGIHFLMHGVYAYFFAKLFMKKYILQIIEEPSLHNESKLFKKAVKDAFAVAVMGSNSKKYLLKNGAKEDNIFIPPCEFYVPQNITKKVFKDKKYDLIYLGNFVDVKDLPLWVDVVYRIKAEIPNIRCIMLGDGVLFDNIKQLVKDKGLERNIDIVGRKSNIFDYITDSKLLLMTSKSEGLPVVITEAMSLGVPVIVPNVGDVKDIVKDNINGFVVDSRDPEHYKSIVVDLLQKSEKYQTLSKNSVKTMQEVSKSSSLDSLVSMWNDVLKKI